MIAAKVIEPDFRVIHDCLINRVSRSSRYDPDIKKISGDNDGRNTVLGSVLHHFNECPYQLVASFGRTRAVHSPKLRIQMDIRRMYDLHSIPPLWYAQETNRNRAFDPFPTPNSIYHLFRPINATQTCFFQKLNKNITLPSAMTPIIATNGQLTINLFCSRV